MIDFKNNNLNKSKNSMYILNLNKKRIAIISTCFGMLLILTFLLGFSIGAFSSKGNTTEENNLIDLNKNIAKTEKRAPSKTVTTTEEKQKEVEVKGTEENNEVVDSPDGNSTVDVAEDTDSNNENNDVKKRYTRIAPAGKVNTRKYFIQILASSNKKKVDFYSHLMRKKGYRSFVKKTSRGYILSIGIFSNKKIANIKLAELKKDEHYQDSFVKLGFVKK